MEFYCKNTYKTISVPTDEEWLHLAQQDACNINFSKNYPHKCKVFEYFTAISFLINNFSQDMIPSCKTCNYTSVSISNILFIFYLHQRRWNKGGVVQGCNVRLIFMKGGYKASFAYPPHKK